MSVSEKTLTESLFELQDISYLDFQSKLVPNVEKERIIGIRTPILRKFAKEFGKTEKANVFLNTLPHYYYEENNLHAFLLEQVKDFETLCLYLDKFLPYVDNWATCDMMSPKIFAKHKSQLLKKAKEWILSEHIYEVRFGIGVLMKHFLDEDFDEAQSKLVSSIKSDEYYINMMIAWYFATALTKQYDGAIKVLENNELDVWLHNKTIQKAIESNRITSEIKEKLKGLKR